jgi:RimJ/RimL family protein N-acetyltransferase
MSAFLQGLLVDLVPPTNEFHDKMYQFWNNESRVWAMMGENEPVSRASINRIIEERSGAAERGYTGVHFMMKAKDGALIGSMGLNWVNTHCRFAWVGGWIGESNYWGGGHGTDSLLLLIDYAFRWLDLNRLILSTMGINERAQGNVENCGFKLEGRRREATIVHGQRIDELTYGLLREEWRGREALVEELHLRDKAEQRYGNAAVSD